MLGGLLLSASKPSATIRYLNLQLTNHQRTASLYGILRRSEQPYESVSDDLLGQPLSNTRIELRSEDKTFVAVTDSNGVYAFYDVPEREYHFAGELPDHLEFAEEILGGPLPPIKLPAHACFESDVTALPARRIRGRVVAPDGKPLSFADVYLFKREKYPPQNTRGWYEAQDREKGYFEFKNVGAGDYVLSTTRMALLKRTILIPALFTQESEI